MLFASLSYLFFLSLTAAAYYLLPGRWRWIWLALASVAYYLSFIPIFLALIGVLVTGNYMGGRWILKANEGGGQGRQPTEFFGFLKEMFEVRDLSFPRRRERIQNSEFRIIRIKYL